MVPLATWITPRPTAIACTELVRSRVHVRVGSALAVVVLSGLVGCSRPADSPESTAAKSPVAGSLTDLADAQMRAQAQCLIDLGWQITINADSYDVEVPPEQREAHEADDARCSAQVTKSLPAPSIGPEKYRSLYRHQLAMVKCLEAEGYPPQGEPPSEQEFVDDAVRNGGARWSAWNAVDQPSDPAALDKKCPQLPPDW